VTDTEEGTFAPGTVFEAKYRIERLLGRGGMGEVYAATHTLLDKLVAVKVLLPEYATDAAMVSRMTREARAASATGHPNIALVTDMGWTGDRPFIVMEMVNGETLESRIERGPVPVDLALTWMDQILDALEAVHAKDLIHRDLKPANLMLTPSRNGALSIKVLDFGISKSTQAEADGTGHTGTGQIVGTPRAMAPEQARALSDLDARADVHAAGSVLYTMLTGSPPFAGPTVMAVLARLLEGRFEPASALNTSVPPVLDAVIAKALAVERDHRYPSARAMRLALADVRTQLDNGVAFAAAGPPSIHSDVDLPRDRTLETPTNSPMPLAAPTITAVAEPMETEPSMPGEPSLQLDVPEGWVPGQPAASPSASSHRVRASINWGWWAMVSVLIAVAVGAWLNWDALTLAATDATQDEESAEPVLILVDTKPKNAIVFVDGVQNDDRPLQIPRSRTPVKLRVVAEGYEPRVMQFVPERTRRLKIDLTRLR